MFDFKSARFWAEELLRQAVLPGEICVDATMGNGGDTALLCELVGETGRVIAFDVQKEALRATEEKLQALGYAARATLILEGHEHMARHVSEPAGAVVFNLGWLPGTDKRITTQTDTTLRALEQALSLLRVGGLITLCAYPGHEEGDHERAEVLTWAENLPPKDYHVMLRCYLNQINNPPLLLAIQKRRHTGGVNLYK